MRSLLAFFISTFAFVHAAHAGQTQSRGLTELCLSQVERTLDPDLQELLTRYATLEQRRQNPKAYVADVERFLLKTGYGRKAMDCRTGLPLKLELDDNAENPSPMKLDVDFDRQGELLSMTLTFSLVMRPLNAIYNYAHELMHVCHRDEARPLWKSMYVKFNSLSRAEKYYYSGAQDAKERGIPNPEFEEIQARILRNNLISELDSFKYQLQSYTEQARTSPGLCEKSETAQYTAMEADWRKGIFAQVTLSGYVAGLDNADARVFDPASALLSYEDKASRTSFQMRTFHPEIVAFINASGIPYFLVGR